MAAVLNAVSELVKEGSKVLTGCRGLREKAGTVCWDSLNSQGEQKRGQGGILV